MDAAVVELDTLADADGAGADDDSPAAGHCLGLVLLLVGAVEIGGLCRKLCGAGVDHLVDGTEAPVLAEVADLLGEAGRLGCRCNRRRSRDAWRNALEME